MRILIVDNTQEPQFWGSAPLRRLALLAPGASVHTRRAPHGDLPKSISGYDRVILSGSGTSAMADAPWISDLHQFVKSALDANVPFLGVCYGHQTLARVVSGSQICRKAATPEIGWTKIELSDQENSYAKKSQLLKGLPDSFYSFSSHYEEVGTLPKAMRNLAHSKDCAIQAFEVIGAPAFGIQFHPERDLKEAEDTFEEKRQDPKTKNDPLLYPKKSRELYDPKIGETIFKNFLDLT